MEQFSVFGLVLSCLALPIILILLVAFAYALGIGGIKLPGVTLVFQVYSWGKQCNG